MADSIAVKCPNCQRKLKITDPALFGRKVKCPDCKTPFVLTDPRPQMPVEVSPSQSQTPRQSPADESLRTQGTDARKPAGKPVPDSSPIARPVVKDESSKVPQAAQTKSAQTAQQGQISPPPKNGDSKKSQEVVPKNPNVSDSDHIGESSLPTQAESLESSEPSLGLPAERQSQSSSSSPRRGTRKGSSVDDQNPFDNPFENPFAGAPVDANVSGGRNGTETPFGANPFTTDPAQASPFGPGPLFGDEDLTGDEGIGRSRAARSSAFKQTRSKKNSSGLQKLIAGSVVIAGIGLIGSFIYLQFNPPATSVSKSAVDPSSTGADALAGTPNAEVVGAGNVDASTQAVSLIEAGPYTVDELAKNPALVDEYRPTNGEPISGILVPSGTTIFVHLRPAELWAEDSEMQGVRASLTDAFADWVKQQILSTSHRDPSEIEEIGFHIVCGARGSLPLISTSVMLKTDESLEELFAQLPGAEQAHASLVAPAKLKVDGSTGYLVTGSKTYAVFPVALIEDLLPWSATENYELPDGLIQLLKTTDRLRHFTVVANLNDVEIHQQLMFPKPAQAFFKSLLNWIGRDIETVSVSLQATSFFHAQIISRAVTTKNPATLSQELQEKLEKLPQMLEVELCEKLKPQEVRFQEFIDRLPSMVHAFQQATVVNRDGRNIRMTTVLPQNASPNLALAALFTINEAARTTFTTARTSGAGAPKLPETLAERVELPVDAEFSSSPLEPAIQYLCGEIKVRLFVDGDALKDAGYTKNMPQTFKLGKVPMKVALTTILDRYQETGKEMVACFDESKMMITVTTRKFAEKAGLTVSLP